MTDYIFKFTDPAKTNFVVKPYTFNGHVSPGNPGFYSNSSTTAVNATTSVVFLGKGLPDYGDAIQNNFIYMMEHFANSVPPLKPIEGQIWYKNNALPGPLGKGLYVYDALTTAWGKLLTDSPTGANGDFNMGGFNITNLGGAGIQFTAANQTYVTTAVSAHAANDALHLTTAQNALLDGLASTLTFTELNYIDGVTSPVQSQLDTKLPSNGSVPMSGNLSLGAFRITSLATPLQNDDAVTKLYVDSAITASGADGTVNAGSFNPITGVLTLTRSIGTPVTVSGTMAPTVHSHSDANVTHNVASPVNQSFLVGRALDAGTYPTPPVYETLVYLDQAVYELQRPSHRQILVAAGGETNITLRSDMAYIVDENKLQVYNNGIKQYASERGISTITYSQLSPTTIGLTSDTGLSSSTTYSFSITANGGTAVTISITTPASSPSPYTYSMLLLDIVTALTFANVAASVTIEQYFNRISIIFTSHVVGAGSSIVVTAGSLFAAIDAADPADPLIPSPTMVGPTNVAITASYSYGEVGFAGDPSLQITFTTPLAPGSVIELIRLS